MKKSTILFTLAVLLFLLGNMQSTSTAQTNATTGATAARTEIKPVYLENYFLKNTVKLKADVNLLASKDSVAFYKQFGMGRTMSNTIVKPDFAKNSIVAIACKATKIATSIAVERIISNVTGVDIYVKITQGEKQTYTSTPMVMLVLPKQNKGTTINVIRGEFSVAKGSL